MADWKKLGLNFAMSPEFDISKNSKENFIKILDEAEKNNIKIVVCDSRSYWHNLSRGEEEYRKGFLSALSDFGSHPAVIGFHVGDEPDRDNLDMCCKAYCIQKELAPNLSPFFNLLAWNHDQKAIKDLTGYNDWEAYLENVWEKTHCDLLCYDCYFQMNPNGEYWDTYFANLNYHNTVAQRHNIPWWTTLLSVGHFRYECPDADALRWQINTAVAHGAKGIIWFY
ncbi:MAG: hypothetical protein KBT47_03440, partial [Armatimonadetes bacterium]|nr:hypothetical protein [Candidatus Hippobium faecium]